MGKIRHADIPVVGPLQRALAELASAVRGLNAPPKHLPWLRQLEEWRARFPFRYSREAGSLKPQTALESLRDLTAGRDDVVWATGVGQHQMWAMQYLQCDTPRSFITSGGLGTMGFGIPAAIGAKAARPDATVVCVDGDGCFQMTCQELATAALEGLPIVAVVINNGWLGMVRQWQEMFYDNRFEQTHLTQQVPDYAQLAEAYGCAGFTVETEDALDGGADRRVRVRAHGRGRRPLRSGGEGVPDGPVGRRRGRHDRGAGRDGVRPWSCSSGVVCAAGGNSALHGPKAACAQRCQPFVEPAGAKGGEGHDEYTIMRDKPGALARVSQLFSRRGYNIQSLAVGPTESPDISRLTLRVDCSEHSLEQIEKQMHKLVNVLRVTELRPEDSIERELALITVAVPTDRRAELVALSQVAGAQVANVGRDAITFEIVGRPDQVDAFEELVRPYGVRELARTGRIGLRRSDAPRRAPSPALI